MLPPRPCASHRASCQNASSHRYSSSHRIASYPAGIHISSPDISHSMSLMETRWALHRLIYLKLVCGGGLRGMEAGQPIDIVYTQVFAGRRRGVLTIYKEFVCAHGSPGGDEMPWSQMRCWWPHAIDGHTRHPWHRHGDHGNAAWRHGRGDVTGHRRLHDDQRRGTRQHVHIWHRRWDDPHVHKRHRR